MVQMPASLITYIHLAFYCHIRCYQRTVSIKLSKAICISVRLLKSMFF